MESDHSSEQELAFEKARFDYCLRLFEQEEKRKETLEGKAQFYLSFVTLFMSIVLLNIDFLKAVSDAISKVNANSSASDNFWVNIIHWSMVLWLSSILFALFSILQSMKLKKYEKGYPPHLSNDLFLDDLNYFKQKDEISLLEASAKEYGKSFRKNYTKNNEKAQWVGVSFFSILMSVFSLVLFLAGSLFLIL